MPVDLLDLPSEYRPFRDEIHRVVDQLLDSGQFILGRAVSDFERSVADRLGARHAIGVSSGTDALLLALMSLDIGPGDEVITTPYSFFATAGCVVRLGARPVFVDIDPVTFNIDPRQIPAALTARTRAILPVHLFGQSADMGPILEIAHQHHLPVIEDAAQALGAQYADGRSVGTLGQFGCYSFFPSKNLGCMGDAGMVVTNDDNLADKARVLRVHGAKPKYFHRLVGGNFRLDALQAAVLQVKLPSLQEWTRRRQENAHRYQQLLGHLSPDIGLPQPVYRDVPGLTNYHVYNQFVVRIPNRNQVQQDLSAAGIGCAIYYPLAFHQQECFANLGYGPGDFPEAEKAAEQTLAIPIAPHLTEQDQQEVARQLIDSVQRSAPQPTTGSR